MKFLHADYRLTPEDIVEVTVSAHANVMLLDEQAFSAYRHDRSYKYTGGWTQNSPVRLSPPFAGRWHLVIDLGGSPGEVGAGVQIFRGSGLPEDFR
jgi:Domain of unknown function (DUF1883)